MKQKNEYNKLFPGWYSASPVDYELNTYRLLAFLDQIRQSYSRMELYPHLELVKRNHDEVSTVISGTREIKNSVRGVLTGIDTTNLKLIYSNKSISNAEWDEVERTLEFALPKLAGALDDGMEMEHQMNDHFEIEPVGLLPLYRKEGYLILYQEKSREAHVYGYSGRIIQQDAFGKANVTLTYLQKCIYGIGQSFISIKRELVKTFKDLPNPATFIMVSKRELPLNACLVPIAGKEIVKWID